MSTTVPPRLRCTDLVQRLPSGGSLLTILDHVDLTIEAGEFVAVLGPSGSGKSTLLGLLAGLDRPTGGSVELDGQALQSMNEDRLALLRREKVGFIFQSFQLLGNLTAYENVRLPLDLNGFDAAHERTLELLERVGIAARGHHYPSQLSGGEQQRVAIARAFAPRPSILLADEPTGNLDQDTGRSVLDLLVELQAAEAMTVVLVTHDSHVAELAGRQIHLEAGRVVSDERTARRVGAAEFGETEFGESELGAAKLGGESA